ncbi:MAG: diguanylate cyclase [Thermoplasmata archaeon]|nr:diguanylate cyclase [Thermoplasmata archaeon]
MIDTDPNLYTGLDVFCIVLMVILLLSDYFTADRGRSRTLFRRMLVAATVMILFDMLGSAAEDGHIRLPKDAIYVLNLLSLWGLAFTSFFWVRFCGVQRLRYGCTGPDGRRFWRAFLIVTVLVIATNWWTHWFFDIAVGHIYVAGPLYPVMMVMLCFPALAAMFLSARDALRAGSAFDRRGNALLASFTIPVLAFGFAQAAAFGLPLLSMGVVLGCVIVYMNLQTSLITEDPLTQINNSVKMDRQIRRALDDRSVPFRIALMDIDNFKRMNDRYGHAEGDEVLKTMARALVEACGDTDCVPARYRWDEFVITYRGEDVSEVDAAIIRLNGILGRESEGRPYTLHSTAGILDLDETHLTHDDVVGAVYAEKTRAKREAGLIR